MCQIVNFYHTGLDFLTSNITAIQSVKMKIRMNKFLESLEKNQKFQPIPSCNVIVLVYHDMNYILGTRP